MSRCFFFLSDEPNLLFLLLSILSPFTLSHQRSRVSTTIAIVSSTLPLSLPPPPSEISVLSIDIDGGHGILTAFDHGKKLTLAARSKVVIVMGVAGPHDRSRYCSWKKKRGI
ncbi:hypothetical protein PIB30_086655 [Stylosanthes scabra]|uniref:Uncharacterized protein n=1 Tax=Stylosanthes scabra TaxID=79078 RepID=A0ABU6ZRV3_9FABA|nr:hypothetical protein [Stylosanthes scabra]